MSKSILRSNFIATALTAVLLAAGLCACNSTSLNINPADLSSVAIVSVSGNTSIPWYVPVNERTDEDDGEISNSGLSAMVNKTLRGNDAELLSIETRIDSSAEILKETFGDFGIDVVPVEKVYETPVLDQRTFNFLTDYTGSTPAEGYDVVNFTSKVRNKEICSYTGAKCVCFAEFEYRKYKKQVSFEENDIYAHVTMKIYMENAEGKKILQKEFVAISDDYVAASTIKKYSKEKLVELFPSAIKNACNDLLIYLTGITPQQITQNINESALEELTDEQLSQAVKIKLPVLKEAAPAEDAVVEEEASVQVQDNSFEEDSYEGEELDDEPEVEFEDEPEVEE